LIEATIEFPRIHDLERLQQLLPTDSALRDIDADLAWLTEWSIAGRYPADSRDADRDDAEQAVRFARVIVDTVAKSFGT
jgi:HEPN domain-containing protein